jgi:predicted  nucleic acid-binding Zn-ribbon protein
MKHRCPKCGHRFDDNAQAKAAKARWKHTSKADRSAAASAAAKARWKTKKAAPGPSNTKMSGAPEQL